ncbi:MAG: hypothetical protein JXQ82_07275 [Methanomicrobiaceae archaeon]|nr:hypothetical protein [Methanomicrobiaceae archaeon]
MTIKIKILNALLSDSKMTTSKIADYCGYEGNVNKYGVVDKPLKQLVIDGLLIRDSLTHEKGRPASTYQIKNDLETILKIYEDFWELRDDIRNQDWIIDLIFSNKLKIEYLELEEEIRQMLKLSPTFFHLSLIHPSINDLADYWYEINRRNRLDDDLRNSFTEKYIDSPYKYHEFFTFCVYYDGLSGINIDQSLIYLDTILERLRERDYSLEEFSMSRIMMSLKKVCDLYEKNDFETLNWLSSQTTFYEAKKQAYEDMIAENEDDPETYNEMINIYSGIINKLSLGDG